MSAIRWVGRSPATIEQAIQILLVELHDGARPIDGRGGDGGRDVRWDSPTGLVIFEIKSFTERLGPTQRREVERSLARAASHRPVRWEVILPLEHSPSEETWFDALRDRYPSIQLEWRGLAWLNGHFGTREHLRRFVEDESYQLLLLAKEFGHEEAVIADVGDLVHRVARLRERGQALTTHRLDFATTTHGVDLGLTARLATDDLPPDALDELFAFPADDTAAGALHRQLVDVLDYGGDITIDRRYLRPHTDLETTSIIGGLFQPGGPTEYLRITTETVTTGPPPSYQLVLVAVGGTVKHRLGLVPEATTIGRRGVRVTVREPSGIFTAVLRADRPELGGAVRTRLTSGSIAGKYPYAVRAAYELFRHAEATDHLQLRVDDRVLGDPFDITPDRMATLITDAQHAATVIAALERLQAHTGQTFLIPDELSASEVDDVLLADRLVTGEEVRTNQTSFGLNIRGDRLAAFVELQATLPPGGLLLEPGQYAFTCGDHTLELGHVTIRAPRLALANLPELRVAGDAGATARYVCTDGEGIYLQLTEPVPAGATPSPGTPRSPFT